MSMPINETITTWWNDFYNYDGDSMLYRFGIIISDKLTNWNAQNCTEKINIELKIHKLTRIHE